MFTRTGVTLYKDRFVETPAVQPYLSESYNIQQSVTRKNINWNTKPATTCLYEGKDMLRDYMNHHAAESNKYVETLANKNKCYTDLAEFKKSAEYTKYLFHETKITTGVNLINKECGRFFVMKTFRPQFDCSSPSP